MNLTHHKSISRDTNLFVDMSMHNLLLVYKEGSKLIYLHQHRKIIYIYNVTFYRRGSGESKWVGPATNLHGRVALLHGLKNPL